MQLCLLHQVGRIGSLVFQATNLCWETQVFAGFCSAEQQLLQTCFASRTSDRPVILADVVVAEFMTPFPGTEMYHLFEHLSDAALLPVPTSHLQLAVLQKLGEASM